jgi:hypothetical protein
MGLASSQATPPSHDQNIVSTRGLIAAGQTHWFGSPMHLSHRAHAPREAYMSPAPPNIRAGTIRNGFSVARRERPRKTHNERGASLTSRACQSLRIRGGGRAARGRLSPPTACSPGCAGSRRSTQRRSRWRSKRHPSPRKRSGRVCRRCAPPPGRRRGKSPGPAGPATVYPPGAPHMRTTLVPP